MEALKGLYHADKMDEKSFIENFTIRIKEFRMIVDNLLQQKKKPLQHFLITGKRGMGKSTLLRRIYIEAAKPPISEKLFVVRLGAEQYRLSRLFKLWEMVIEQLGNDEPELLKQKENLGKSRQYEDNLVFIINDYLTKAGKTLLLLIDNFDQFIDKIPAKDQHVLREILIVYPIQIIGNAVFYNEHFRSYTHPFFDFFKPVQLDNLNKVEAREFIKSRAIGEGIENFEEIYKYQKGKINALRILSGGVPRTLLILLSIVSRKNTGNAVDYLHEMIELVTPLYQDRMKALSPQQQEIMHSLAMRWDKSPVKELAAEMRVPSKSISAQLVQLEKSGYIKKIDVPGRNHYYEIDERFFNIWLLMSEAAPYDTRRVIWLTKWLDAYYTNKELKGFAKFCQTGLKEIKPGNRFLIAQALSESVKLEWGYKKQLIHEMLEDLKDVMSDVKVWVDNYNRKLTKEELLLKKEIFNLINAQDFEGALDRLCVLEKVDETFAIYLKGVLYVKKGDLVNAEKYLLMSADRDNVEAMAVLGLLYQINGKDIGSAEKYNLMAVEKGSIWAMDNLAHFYLNVRKDVAAAEKYYKMSAENGSVTAMLSLGFLYDFEKKDVQSSEKYYLMAVEKDNTKAMVGLANLYLHEKRDIAAAEKYYTMAMEKGDVRALTYLGYLYAGNKKDVSGAEKYFLMAAEMGDSSAMTALGYLYMYDKKDVGEAERYLLMALKEDKVDAMFDLGLLYDECKDDIAGAEKYYRMAVDRGDTKAMLNLGLLYKNKKKDVMNAEKYYQMAIAKNMPDAMANLANLYFEMNDISKKEKALELSGKAMELTDHSDIIALYIHVGVLLWNEKAKEAGKLMIDILQGPLHSDDNMKFISESLQYFLVFKQKQFLYKLFSSNPEWVDRYKPEYYTLLSEMQDEYLKDYLKMSEELEEPVMAIRDFIIAERKKFGIR